MAILHAWILPETVTRIYPKTLEFARLFNGRKRMNLLTFILKANGVKVEILTAGNAPGNLVFEDHWYISAVPSNDVWQIK